MANLAVPTALAAAGSYFGPVGAAIGWTIGSYLTAEDAPTEELPDLRVQTSQYGSGLPFIAGTQRLSGNIIWSADKTTYDVDTGGKGGPPGSNQTGYKISLAIAICQGPILGVSAVWEQGEITAAPQTGSPPSGQNKLPGKLYLGSNTQNPDPTIEAIEGVGNVPAYRGIAYMVLTDFDLGVSGAIPQFTFEVVKDEAL